MVSREIILAEGCLVGNFSCSAQQKQIGKESLKKKEANSVV
jgi:hypothetical protein